MNFSSRRNLGKFTANLKETQMCYLQIPICNVVITITEKQTNSWTSVKGLRNSRLISHKPYNCVSKLNTLKAGSFKLFKRPFPGFLTTLTL